MECVNREQSVKERVGDTHTRTDTARAYRRSTNFGEGKFKNGCVNGKHEQVRRRTAWSRAEVHDG